MPSRSSPRQGERKGETMSETEARSKKVKGMGGVYCRDGLWYTRYRYRGETYRESSGSRLKSVARDLLKKRIS
jgi:hypothetical protein